MKLEDENAFVSLVNELDREAAALEDDGEWLPSDVAVPLDVFAADGDPGMLFCPKAKVLHDVAVALRRYTIVGRFGVVTAAEHVFLERARRGAPLFFVGDLDPMDLTAFLGLDVAAKHVRYVGLGGAMFDLMNASTHGLRSILMNEFERWHWGRLQDACPRIRALIGEAAASLLDHGRKLELEGALHSPHHALFTRHIEVSLAEG